ncbi:phosphoglucomutase/phosphomannomutase family protein [Brevibacillus daliensis]|uniref:phosphoglucomutase/phosphomannomutase family protein n=1 Tax=Brevibacillus daliensis TaxID=2892995 RepID=UPI001E5835E5|nr:phosphoglucomutase/phosphomannomutase family protein [Brevibacillus daliensis]
MSGKIAFGTDGWRAIFADQFTMENVRVVTKAIALYTEENGLKERGVIVGYDRRFMGRSFAEEVGKVLTAHGILTFLVNDATPTPIVAFGVKHFGVSGAIMLTASHNPPEYNGIKYIPEYAGPASASITSRLEELISQIQIDTKQVDTMQIKKAKALKLYKPILLKPHYEAHIRRLIQLETIKQAGLAVVVDAMHGAGSGYMGPILQEAGVKVTSIRTENDPLFGGSMPDPTKKHLSLLQSRVVEEGAALGLANDGDADRFGVVDSDGRYISPNEVLVMLTYHLLKNRQLRGKIVRTVATTHLLDRIAQAYGLELIETPVGFKYIGAEMEKGNVLIGGEESGGASILGHIPEKDGILINLLLTEMCAYEGKKIDQILNEIYSQFGQLFSARLDMKVKNKKRFLQYMEKHPLHQVAGYTVTSIGRIDGWKIVLEDGDWILIRPSGTEPLIRIYCEANGQEELDKVLEAVRDWIEEGEDG